MPPQYEAAMRYRKTWVSRILLGIPFAFLALPVSIVKPLDPATWVIDAVLVSAYGLLWFLIGRTWIEVSDEGIVRHGLLGTRSVRWDEGSTFWYSANPRNNTAAVGVAGGIVVEAVVRASASRWGKAVGVAYTLRLRAANGRELRITSAFARADEAIAASLRQVRPRLEAAARSALAAGKPIEAGQLVLTRESLRWKQQEPLPIGEIEQAEIFSSGGTTLLRLLKKGKAWRYASIDTRKLPLVPLLLDLLRDRGVTVLVPDWFEP